MRIYPWIVSALFYSPVIWAFPAVVLDPIPCFLDLEIHFFTEPIVYQGLSLYNIRQELWVPIYVRLKQKSLEVPERVKRRTAYMVPNPLEYPMRRAVAAKILKEVLFEVFMETMRDYNSNERPTADLVFDYIFTLQLPNFIKCFGPEVEALRPHFD